MGFRNVSVDGIVVFEQAVNIRFIKKAPIEIRNLFAAKTFPELID